jgi:hypothetical protein
MLIVAVGLATPIRALRDCAADDSLETDAASA